jgi:hypothetical protein
MIKSKRKNGQACNIYGKEEKYVDVLVRKPEGDYLEYVGGDGKIILKWLLKKQDGTAGTRFIWLIACAVLNTVMDLQVS